MWEYATGFLAGGLMMLIFVLHPFDRLAAGAGIELDQTKEVAQIGQGQCRHAIASGLLDGITDADNAVGDGIFGMETEMDVAR